MNRSGLLLFVVVFCSPLALAPVSAPAAEAFSSSGDLRLRHESTRRDPGEDVGRERYRLRLAGAWEPVDGLAFGMRIATDKGDPASANLDFGESLTLDRIRLDRAYVDWSATEALQFTVGKMKNPNFRPGGTGLVWDSDVNPRGVAASVDRGRTFGNAGAYLADDRNGSDAWLYAAQAGMRLPAFGTAELIAGVGWLHYTGMAGHPALYDRPRGNSVDADGNYLRDFAIAELFGELQAELAGRPITLFAAWARNTEAADEDTAYALGATLGDAEQPGDTAYTWEWRDTGNDALVGTFTDSTFADGNTGSRGHTLSAEYRLNEHIGAGVTVMFAKYGGSGAAHTDFDRLLFDLVLSF